MSETAKPDLASLKAVARLERMDSCSSLASVRSPGSPKPTTPRVNAKQKFTFASIAKKALENQKTGERYMYFI